MNQVESSTPSVKNEALFIFILTMLQFSHILDFVIMMPLGPKLMRIFSINPKEFSLMVSSYTFSASLFGLLSAFFIDRFDRKKSLMYIYVGFIVGTAICAFAPNFFILLAGRIIAGAFGGIIAGLVFSIVADTIPFSRRGMATGKIMSAFSLASVLGVPFGLYIADMFNWHAPFLFIIFLSLFILVLVHYNIPSLTSHFTLNRPTSEWQEVINIFKVKNHLWSFLLVTILMFASFSVIPFISAVMVFNAGLPEADLAYIYLVGGAFTFFTARLFGRLSDRFGKTLVFFWIALASIVPLIMLTNISKVGFVYAITTTTLFMVFTSGRFIPAMAIITGSSAKEMRGRFMSLNSCVQQLASGLASLTAGFIITSGENNRVENYHWVGVMALFSVFLSLIIIRKIKVIEQQ